MLVSKLTANILGSTCLSTARGPAHQQVLVPVLNLTSEGELGTDFTPLESLQEVNSTVYGAAWLPALIFSAISKQFYRPSSLLELYKLSRLAGTIDKKDLGAS